MKSTKRKASYPEALCLRYNVCRAKVLVTSPQRIRQVMVGAEGFEPSTY